MKTLRMTLVAVSGCVAMTAVLFAGNGAVAAPRSASGGHGLSEGRQAARVERAHRIRHVVEHEGGVLAFPTDNVDEGQDGHVLAFPTDNVDEGQDDHVLAFPTDNVLAFPTDNVLAFPTDNVLAFPTDNVLAFPTDNIRDHGIRNSADEDEEDVE